LKGGFATGLLIGVSCWPSAPSSGEVWELFGLLNGKLSRLGKPFTTDGAFLGLIPNPPQKRGRATLFLPDVMHFRVWTGNFHVTVPVRVDRMQGRLVPRHVVVRKDSRVEFLGAKIKLSWDASHEVLFFGADDQDPWLKVSIDGQEDFDAVGVPRAG
jgi:hypothetical protein